jgi:hypothetical protein
MVTVRSTEFLIENADVEFGYLLENPIPGPIRFDELLVLDQRQVEAVETMATIVHVGGPTVSNIGYGALGEWIEANNYRIAGPQREIFLNLVPNMREEDLVIELQFPVVQLAPDSPFLLSILNP